MSRLRPGMPPLKSIGNSAGTRTPSTLLPTRTPPNLRLKVSRPLGERISSMSSAFSGSFVISLPSSSYCKFPDSSYCGTTKAKRGLFSVLRPSKRSAAPCPGPLRRRRSAVGNVLEPLAQAVLNKCRRTCCPGRVGAGRAGYWPDRRRVHPRSKAARCNRPIATSSMPLKNPSSRSTECWGHRATRSGRWRCKP